VDPGENPAFGFMPEFAMTAQNCRFLDEGIIEVTLRTSYCYLRRKL
jgi:hypothetical protein